MPAKDYKITYLPQFYEDLILAMEYISETIQNPGAAKRFLDHVEKSIIERRPFAESFETYPSRFEHKYPYYRIYIDNYVIYYVVIDLGSEKIMEVRRLLHQKQNRNHIV